MSDDQKPYQYPFEMAPEEEIRFRDAGADPSRPAGVPSSYDEGGSTRWTPEAISEVHALAQLGRYQVRGYNTFNKRMPTFDDLTFVPATMTRLPLEGLSRELRHQDGARRAAAALSTIPSNWTFRSISHRCPSARSPRAPRLRSAHGASKVGTMTCTGEGGMLEEEREAIEDPGLPDVAGPLRSSTSITCAARTRLETGRRSRRQAWHRRFALWA